MLNAPVISINIDGGSSVAVKAILDEFAGCLVLMQENSPSVETGMLGSHYVVASHTELFRPCLIALPERLIPYLVRQSSGTGPPWVTFFLSWSPRRTVTHTPYQEGVSCHQEKGATP
eukprot:4969365-Amphidinium_carterae.2